MELQKHSIKVVSLLVHDKNGHVLTNIAIALAKQWRL